jgi:ribosome maturation factor RimP
LLCSAALLSGGFAPTFLCASSPCEYSRKAGGKDGDERGFIGRARAEIAERAATEQGLELVHAEIAGPEGKPILRIYIDKPNGVTHTDCSAMSLHLGTVLDVEDFIHSAYTLEVSSPGLERGLYKPADYERFAGSLARLKTRVAFGGQRNFRGRIVGLTDSKVIFDDKTSGRVEMPLKRLSKRIWNSTLKKSFAA